MQNTKYNPTRLAYDLPETLRQNISQSLIDNTVERYGNGAFSLHPFILLHIVVCFDKAVWLWRDVVRDIETGRKADGSVYTDSFEHMHETARHVIHSSETLATALSVVQSISKDIVAHSLPSSDFDTAAVLRETDFCHSLLTSLLHRSQALEKRLANEIALAFHLDARHNNKLSSHIAELAQRDGETTKGISFLGTLFLPGTFVSRSGDIQDDFLRLYTATGCLNRHLVVLGHHAV
ncbi:hypothetical protein LTR82_018213 [Friedmanniomyces endolithicus]|uniref:Uncharacterized protein n=1 Tax=Friedmanniomyces endolithicus TaxID=329885 RepID=A0AAN6F4A7_9PEZI|nr:hypothetical protein LTR82_018213 [Friedmanniomyces endolithicus]